MILLVYLLKFKISMKKVIIFLFLTFVFLYPIPYTLYPVHAEVKIGEKFGFGNIQTLGQGTSLLVIPVFSIATTLVVLYFLWGAWHWIVSGGDKEKVQAAKNIITHSIVGFFILMFAFLVLQFLLSSLFKINFNIIG